MKTKSTYEKLIAIPEQRRLLEQEMFILEATECLSRAMEREGISKTQLAEMLGKSKAFVTQVLNGGRNMTMRTFADIMCVLGYAARIQEQPAYQKQISTVIHVNWPRRKMFTEIEIKGDRLSSKTSKTDLAV